MERQVLSLWTYAAAESMFLYYFIGALALIFFITVFITKALRRKKSQVIELPENEDFNELSVTYLVAITTSLRLGAGCPNNVKVFMQLLGNRNVSPYFTLRADKKRRPLLKRGFTDIFLVKVKESVGRIQKVKLVVSGIDGCLNWRISEIVLYSPGNGSRRSLPVIVVAAETLEDPELENIMLQTRCTSECCTSIIIYHQWLSRIGNTVRFGAFSDIVHVLFLFTSLLTLFILTLISYIAFPKPNVDRDTFSLNYTSFAIGSSISAVACFGICLMFEVLMRNVRSQEKDLNYAYYSLKERKKYRKLYHQSKQPQNEAFKKQNELRAKASEKSNMGVDGEDKNELFVLKQSVCDETYTRSRDSFLGNLGQLPAIRICDVNANIPLYIRNLTEASLFHHDHEQEAGIELDKKLSLAIINSATTGINQASHKNLLIDNSVIDAETGEQTLENKVKTIKLRKSTSQGINSRTSLDKYHSLDTSESKFGLSVMDKMSSYFGTLFGGYAEAQDKSVNRDSTAARKILTRDDKGRQDVAVELTSENFVVVNESQGSLVEITIPELETQAWTDDIHESESDQKHVADKRLVIDKYPYLQKPENIMEPKTTDQGKHTKSRKTRSGPTKPGIPMPVTGRCVLDRYTDEVKVEIHPENVASFNEELDNLWEEEANKTEEIENVHSLSDRTQDLLAVDISSDKRRLISEALRDVDRSSGGAAASYVYTNREKPYPCTGSETYSPQQSTKHKECRSSNNAQARPALSDLFRRTSSDIIDLRDPEDIESDSRKIKCQKHSKESFTVADPKTLAHEMSYDKSKERPIPVPDIDKAETESGEFAEPDDDDSIDQSIFTKTLSKHMKSKQACWEIEDSIKTWARSFIQVLLLKFRSYRDSTAEGYVTFQMTWFEVMDWVHEVIFKIINCLVFKGKQELYQKDAFQTPELQNFLGHGAAEVILVAINGVSNYLENEGKNCLADLLLLSHYVMQGISQVTDGLIYCLEVWEKDGEKERLTRMLRQLDVESDLKYVALKFLRDCATWTFQRGSLSWPFIKRLIPTGEEDINDVRDNISSLAILSAVGGLEKYNEVGFIAAKLMQFVIEESQEEIWTEYQNERLVFSDILVKLRILELLRQKISVLEKKKRFLDYLINEHEKKPKSRIQKRMEKRLEAERDGETHTEEDETSEQEKPRFKDKWRLEMFNKEYGDWIREAGNFVRPLLVLCKIKLFLEKRWTKQGLQLHMKAEKHLAQALLHPNLAQAKDQPEGFWFENFLHFKRAESILGRYLVDTVDHLVKLITQDSINAALSDTAQTEEVIEDIVVKVDIGVQLLTQDEDNILNEVMKLEIVQEKEIDEGIETRLSQLFSAQNLTGTDKQTVEKPDSGPQVSFDDDEDMLEYEYVEDNLEEKGAGRYRETEAAEKRLRNLMFAKGLIGPTEANIDDDDDDVIVVNTNQSAETKEHTELKVEDDTSETMQPVETNKEDDLIQSIMSVLKPLKTYMAYIKREEIIHNQTTLQRYLVRSEKKRQRACSLNYLRLLDSYYIIEEDENNPSHTKESLYQLEHDFMRETVKPLPRVVKTVLIWVMMIMILFSFVYVGCVAGQLSTPETQEWICYYLLSLAEFAFVLEPIRAIIIGLVVK